MVWDTNTIPLPPVFKLLQKSLKIAKNRQKMLQTAQYSLILQSLQICVMHAVQNVNVISPSRNETRSNPVPIHALTGPAAQEIKIGSHTTFAYHIPYHSKKNQKSAKYQYDTSKSESL